METIIFFLKFFLFIFGLSSVILISYWLRMEYKLWKARKRAEQNLYEMKYKWLQNAIHDYEMHKDNYTYIASQLLILYGMKYHNEEKSRVLTDEFNKKYARFREDNQPDEFSPDSIFKK